jgi:hypothetical protein
MMSDIAGVVVMVEIQDVWHRGGGSNGRDQNIFNFLF